MTDDPSVGHSDPTVDPEALARAFNGPDDETPEPFVREVPLRDPADDVEAPGLAKPDTMGTDVGGALANETAADRAVADDDEADRHAAGGSR